MSWIDPWIVVTDLDGTLMDHHTYSWQPAEGALQLLADHHVPVVLCSSKTLAEMRILAEEMSLSFPLIVENGAAVAWPEDGDFRVESMGRPRQEVVDVAHQLRSEHGYQFSGFSDWSVADVVEHSGLTAESAARALERHGTEPIVWADGEDAYDEFVAALAQNQIRAVRGGRFIHLMGYFDKADGMKRVCEYFTKLRNGKVKAIAFGDSPNDAQMLNAADVAVRIRSAQSSDMDLQSRRIIEPQEPGPMGWAIALNEWWQAQGEIPIKE